MKNSSEATLSSQSSSEDLETGFNQMMELAEDELWIRIEFIHGSNSFWVPTPQEELDEDAYEDFGIIEIGDDQSMINKIISLCHEVGHSLHRKNKNFCDVDHTIFSESIAWFLGYDWFHERNIVIDMAEYQTFMEQALKLYIMEFK
jgi:hypothetical protein